MKIYKNSVCIKMELDEFLEILECDLMDQLLDAIVNLDELDDEQIVYPQLYDEDNDEDFAILEEEFSALIEAAFLQSNPVSETDQKVRRMIEFFDKDNES